MSISMQEMKPTDAALDKPTLPRCIVGATWQLDNYIYRSEGGVKFSEEVASRCQRECFEQVWERLKDGRAYQVRTFGPHWRASGFDNSECRLYVLVLVELLDDAMVGEYTPMVPTGVNESVITADGKQFARVRLSIFGREYDVLKRIV